MAFTVEDGSSVDDANAYADVATVDEHHSDRGNERWNDFITTEKQAAIIRASDFIDKRFGRRFRGARRQKAQGLEWPRIDAFDDDGFLLHGTTDSVPRQVLKAVAEYALRAAQCFVLSPDPLSPVPQQTWGSGDTKEDRDTELVTGQIVRKRDKVSTLEEERWYETSSQAASELGSGAKGVQSSLVNDYNIPEYPEADLWLEELIESSMGMRLARGD